MNNLLLIARNILRQLFRQKGGVIIFIVLPIIGIIVPLMMFGNVKETYIRVGILDLDQGTVSQKLMEDIKTQDRFTISFVEDSQINSAIAGGRLDCALVIPEGFTDSFFKDGTKQLEVISVQGVAVTGWLDSYLNTFLQNQKLLTLGSGNDVQAYNTLYNQFYESTTKVELVGVKNMVNNYSITYLGLGFLIQFLLVGAGRTASLIIREQKERTLSRIRCAPVKGYEFISGNVVVNVGMVTLQTLLTLVLLRYVFHINIGVSVLAMMAVMFPLVMAGVGVNLMLVSFSKNENHFGTLSTLFVYPTCLLSGCFWSIDMMPDYMQKLALFFPQRWALDGIEALMMGQKLSDVLLNIGVISAFALAFFALAIFGFSRKQTRLAS